MKKITQILLVVTSILLSSYTPNVECKYAYITNMSTDSITLDYVEIEMKPNTINDFVVINNNNKVRTFLLNDMCHICNCYSSIVLTTHNLHKYTSTLIGKLIQVRLEDEKVVALQLGCFN